MTKRDVIVVARRAAKRGVKCRFYQELVLKHGKPVALWGWCVSLKDEACLVWRTFQDLDQALLMLEAIAKGNEKL